MTLTSVFDPRTLDLFRPEVGEEIIEPFISLGGLSQKMIYLSAKVD